MRVRYQANFAIVEKRHVPPPYGLLKASLFNGVDKLIVSVLLSFN